MLCRSESNIILAPSFLLLLTACGGGSGSTAPPPPPPPPPISVYTVAVTTGTGGSASQSSASVNQGASTNLTFTPAAGYTLASVSGCNGSLTGNIFTTGAISANCTVTAGFKLNTYTINTTTSTDGMLNQTTTTIEHGATTTFTLTPPAGYNLASVSGCNGSLNGNQYTTGAVTADCAITAQYKLNTYTINTTTSTGGSLNQTSATVEHGATTTFTLTPAAGYKIASATGCNGTLTDNQFTTTAVTANCTVNASFARINDQKISGKVIDGYVSGATVWLDLNGNKSKDADEPAAISTQLGNYLLEMTAAQLECAAYATLYVDVPVGAIDEDSGPVTAAYQMARPPQLKPLSNEDVLHISPLTSVLYEQILQKLQNQQQGLGSCETLKANQSLRQDISAELQDQIRSIVQKHNISAEKIFADFIQNNDKASYDLAQSIVTGLKASFAYRDSLKKQYPDATYIRTLFYQGSEIDNNNAYPQAWYRDTAIWLPNGFISKLEKMQDDRSTVQRPVYLRETKKQSWNNATYSYTQDTLNYLGDDADFRCEGQEEISFKSLNGDTFTLQNSAASDKVSDPVQCQAASFDNPYLKYYYVSYYRGGIFYETRFNIRPTDTEYAQLKDWVNLKDKAASLQLLTLYEHLAKTGYKFDEEPKISVDSWYKRSTDDRTKNRVHINKRSDGRWEKQTTRDDQTILKECSQDGVNWGACS